MSDGYYIEEYDRPTVTVWHRINRILWSLLFLTTICLIIGAFWPELQKQHADRKEREQLQRLVDEQQKLHARYERQIGWLQHDPEYLGMVARDKLDRMKEGETILRVDPPKNASLETQRVEPAVKPKSLN